MDAKIITIINDMTCRELTDVLVASGVDSLPKPLPAMRAQAAERYVSGFISSADILAAYDGDL